MSNNPIHLIQKLWNYCSILRDDCLSYGMAEVERRLSGEEELEAVESANSERSRDSVLQRANRLGQSILQKAFTGQL